MKQNINRTVCHFFPAQDCPSRQEIHSSLKQVQKLLSAHEASYLQSLRNLKKKINLLHSSAGKQGSKAVNSKEELSVSCITQTSWEIELFLILSVLT